MANKKALYSVTLKFTSAKQLSNILSSHLPFDCEIVDHNFVKPKRQYHRTQTDKSKKTPLRESESMKTEAMKKKGEN